MRCLQHNRAVTVPITALLFAASGCMHPGVTRGQEPASSYPAAGWRFASPLTTVTFRGVTAAQLADLRVSGAASGVHAGRLHSLRIGVGAVFTPDEPFREGERVTVATSAPVRGADRGRFTFTTARFGRDSADAPSAQATGAATAAAAPQCFPQRSRLRTLPDLRPAEICVARLEPGAVAPGRLLITPRPVERGPGAEWGAAILSRSGKLLWYSKSSDKINDLKTVELGGRPLLALFHRASSRRSYYQLLDESYRPAGRIFAGNGYDVDSHDLQIGPRGTVYLGAYQGVSVASGRRLTDYVVQEVDPVTGDVLFEWHALDHVPRWASYRLEPRAGVAWDYFHGNAIEPPTGQGRTLMVSSRNTSAIYGIDAITGEEQWVLGGRRDRFGLLEDHPGWQFCAQHDVRRTPDGDVTLFDNGALFHRGSADCPPHPARALRFRLDPRRGRARLERSVSSIPSSGSSAGYRPHAVGSARWVGDGNSLVSWGTAGRITEVTRRGAVALRVDLANWSYRAVRAEWTGRPLGVPALAVRRDGGEVHLWASWNGATEIRRWRVLAGTTPERLMPTGRPVAFADLETRIRVRLADGYVAVEALDAGGGVLGRSATVSAT